MNTNVLRRNISKFLFRTVYRYCSACGKKKPDCPPPPTPLSCPTPPLPSINCKILGSNALITGAANGIGFAATKTLLTLGANKVCMLDIDEKSGECASKDLNAQHERDCTCFQKIDVSCPEAMEEAFAKCHKWVRKLDFVFNNAGILNDHKWIETVAINMNAVIHGTMLGFKYMGLDQGHCGGTIINHSSVLGLQPLSGAPVHVGTKHAIIGMTRSWATPFWYDRTGVKMLTLCSGGSPTNLLKWTERTDDTLTKELVRGLGTMPSQPIDKWSSAFAHMFLKGENGSLWYTEDGNSCEIVIPDRSSLNRKCPN